MSWLYSEGRWYVPCEAGVPELEILANSDLYQGVPELEILANSDLYQGNSFNFPS